MLRNCKLGHCKVTHFRYLRKNVPLRGKPTFERCTSSGKRHCSWLLSWGLPVSEGFLHPLPNHFRRQWHSRPRQELCLGCLISLCHPHGCGREMITWQQETQSDVFLAAWVEAGSSKMPTRVQSGYCLPLQESVSGLARRKHSGLLLGKEHAEESPGHAGKGGRHTCSSLSLPLDKSIVCLPGQSEAGKLPWSSTRHRGPLQRAVGLGTSTGLCHRVNETIQPLSQCFMKWEEIHFLSVPSSIIKVLQWFFLSSDKRPQNTAFGLCHLSSNELFYSGRQNVPKDTGICHHEVYWSVAFFRNRFFSWF